jgi:hypothetical protein
MIRWSNPGGGEIFHTRPELPWCPPCSLYSEYWILSRSKTVEVCRWPPTPSSAEVKERVDAYLYSRSGTSWTVLGWGELSSNQRSVHPCEQASLATKIHFFFCSQKYVPFLTTITCAELGFYKFTYSLFFKGPKTTWPLKMGQLALEVWTNRMCRKVGN